MKRLIVNVGDIFKIPIDKNQCVFGQVFYKNHANFPLYVGIFRSAYLCTEIPNFECIVSSEISLVGGTMDSRIYHGHWEIIGNHEVNYNRIPQPKFISEYNGKLVVEDFDGKPLRTAKKNDNYDKRWTRAPMGFENAIKAIHGIGDWSNDHQKLTLEHANQQSK